VGNLSDTALTWQTEEYDTDNFHAQNTNYFIIPYGVIKVRITGSVLWSDDTNQGSRYLYTKINDQFNKNGRGLSAIPKTRSYSMGQFVQTAIISVKEGDVIRLHADQDSGRTTKITKSPPTWFSLEVIE